MPRPRYPSDDKRLKVRPHVRVHLAVANHRKTAGAWESPEQRGMLVELWRIAAEKYAARTGDEILLTPSDLQSIAGRTHLRDNLHALSTLCRRLDYAIRTEDRVTYVIVRNFAKKQGFDSAIRGEKSETPAPPKSEVRIPNKNTVERPARRSEKSAPPPPEWALEAAERLAVCVRRRWPGARPPEAFTAWARQLARIKAPQGDVESLLAWYTDPRLDAEPYIPEARAAESFRRKWDALVAARQRRAPQPTTRPLVQSARSERRERAQRLYSIERLLPEPTEEALALWERSGAPRVQGWWLSEEERRHLRLVG